jgi:hypothetical protein
MFLLFITSSVFSQDGSGEYRVKDIASFYALIKARFRTIDSLRHPLRDIDSFTAESDKIFSIIKSNRDIVINLRDTSNFDYLDVARSADSALCIISWDTRQGGTNIDYASVVLYKAGNITGYKKMEDTSDGDIDNPQIYYGGIFTIPSGNQAIYLAFGFGQGSTALPWQQVKAFMIKGDTLISPAIFPGNQHALFVEFNTNAFTSPQRVPTFKFDQQNLTLKVPVPLAKGGFGGRYYKLKFDKGKFVRVP